MQLYNYYTIIYIRLLNKPKSEIRYKVVILYSHIQIRFGILYLSIYSLHYLLIYIYIYIYMYISNIGVIKVAVRGDTFS